MGRNLTRGPRRGLESLDALHREPEVVQLDRREVIGLKGDLLLEQRRIEQRQFVRVGTVQRYGTQFEISPTLTPLCRWSSHSYSSGDIARARLEMAM